MFLKESNMPAKGIVPRRTKYFLTFMTLCSLFSAFAEAKTTSNTSSHQGFVCKNNLDKRIYLSEKSIAIRNEKLFVLMNHRLFCPLSLHNDERGLYVQERELGSPLGRSVFREKSHNARKFGRIECDNCGARFRTWAELHDHLNQIPPCKKRNRR